MKCCDCNCGGLKPIIEVIPPLPDTPLTIMAGSIVAGWDAADLSSSPVASWPDASGNGFTLTEATNQPSWNATGGPNSQPSVLFDGVDDILSNASLNLPAPGTLLTFYWAVLRQVSWTPADTLVSAGVGSPFLRLFQGSGSPNILQVNPNSVNAHGGLTVNTYKRLEVKFADSSSDYIKAGATAATTGATAGNNDSAAGFQLASAPNIASFGNIEVCEFWIFNTLPTPAQKALLDVYVTTRYGAGLV